jgi:hypothetical protein
MEHTCELGSDHFVKYVAANQITVLLTIVIVDFFGGALVHKLNSLFFEVFVLEQMREVQIQ